MIFISVLYDIYLFLCYMMKAHGTTLWHATGNLSLQMQLFDRAEVLLGIRWSEQKLREKFLSSGSV